VVAFRQRFFSDYSDDNNDDRDSSVFPAAIILIGGELFMIHCVKKEVSPSFSITERSVPELIPDLGSQPAGDVNYKPDGRLPLLSARPAVTPPQPLRGLLPIIGADSTGATGNVAPVLTQEPGQTLRFAPVPFMAVL